MQTRRQRLPLSLSSVDFDDKPSAAASARYTSTELSSVNSAHHGLEFSRLHLDVRLATVTSAYHNVLRSAACTTMSDWLLSLLHTTAVIDQRCALLCETGHCHFAQYSRHGPAAFLSLAVCTTMTNCLPQHTTYHIQFTTYHLLP